LPTVLNQPDELIENDADAGVTAEPLVTGTSVTPSASLIEGTDLTVCTVVMASVLYSRISPGPAAARSAESPTMTKLASKLRTFIDDYILM
jgi:hypothetical protein